MTTTIHRLLAVGIGGIIGALARFGLSLAFNPAAPELFPWGTLLCNLAGCVLLGWLGSLAESRLSPLLKLGLTTGVIGAFTTFSTFSVETVQLLQSGHTIAALLYMAISAGGGLASIQLGMKLASRPQRKEDRP